MKRDATRLAEFLLIWSVVGLLTGLVVHAIVASETAVDATALAGTALLITAGVWLCRKASTLAPALERWFRDSWQHRLASRWFENASNLNPVYLQVLGAFLIVLGPLMYLNQVV